MMQRQCARAGRMEEDGEEQQMITEGIRNRMGVEQSRCK